MQVQKYNDWSFGVQQRLSARRIPISGLIEVTQLCNNKCIHCYNNLPGEDLKAKEEELSFAEYRRILDEIVDAGCLWLLFTGGEIFTRKDFIDIYTHSSYADALVKFFLKRRRKI